MYHLFPSLTNVVVVVVDVLCVCVLIMLVFVVPLTAGLPADGSLINFLSARSILPYDISLLCLRRPSSPPHAIPLAALFVMLSHLWPPWHAGLAAWQLHTTP